MIYSCFDPTVGLYDYYEAPGDIAFNSDLPTPKLPPIAGTIGVPAIDAGRPLPSNAKHVGKGWHARGMVAACGRGSMSGIMDDPVGWVKGGGWKWLVGGLAAWWVARKVL
jgi:hypothetical protein